MKTTPTLSIVSIGFMCQAVQSLPNAIRAAAEELKIRPAYRINAVDHYLESDVERIRKHLAEPPARKSRRK
jgi:hypothetical protein